MDKKVKFVINHYLTSFLFVIVTLFVSYLTVYFFQTLLIKLPVFVYIVGGSVFILTSTIGKLGWKVQTWGGDTNQEKLNHNIFLLLSHLGTFLLFISVFLEILK